MFYKDTPIVKSSNLTLSVFQLILHLIINFHLGITIFEQKNGSPLCTAFQGGIYQRLLCRYMSSKQINCSKYSNQVPGIKEVLVQR